MQSMSQRFAAIQKKQRAQRPKRQRPVRKPRRQLARAVAPRAAPVAIASRPRTMPSPGVRLKRREPLATIYGGSSAHIEKHAINPRLDSTFKWLSSIAWSYDMFKFHALRFFYEPSCPTTLSGSVAMFFDKDPADTNAGINMISMRSMSGSASCNCYQPLMMVVNLSAVLDRTHLMFCDNNPEHMADPLRNIGNLFFGSVSEAIGENSSPLLGYLWVEYDVELVNPEVPPQLTDSATRVNPRSNQGENGNAANPLGTAAGNVPVQSLIGTAAVQGLNQLVQRVGVPVASKLITEHLASCVSTLIPLKAIAPDLEIDSIRHHVPTDDPGLCVMTSEAFAEEEEQACYVVPPSDHRDYIFLFWSVGTWTPDVAEDMPWFRFDTSENVTATEYLYNIASTNNAHAYPVAHTAYPGTVVMASVTVHISNSKPAWIRPYIKAWNHATGDAGMTGTWVSTPAYQRMLVIPTGIGPSGSNVWQPKVEL